MKLKLDVDPDIVAMMAAEVAAGEPWRQSPKTAGAS
jgi:hypothetical protein